MSSETFSGLTDLQQVVMEVIQASQGINHAQIVEITELPPTQVRGVLASLRRWGHASQDQNKNWFVSEIVESTQVPDENTGSWRGTSVRIIKDPVKIDRVQYLRIFYRGQRFGLQLPLSNPDGVNIHITSDPEKHHPGQACHINVDHVEVEFYVKGQLKKETFRVDTGQSLIIY